jgi:hypothetical protein
MSPIRVPCSATQAYREAGYRALGSRARRASWRLGAGERIRGNAGAASANEPTHAAGRRHKWRSRLPSARAAAKASAEITPPLWSKAVVHSVMQHRWLPEKQRRGPGLNALMSAARRAAPLDSFSLRLGSLDASAPEHIIDLMTDPAVTSADLPRFVSVPTSAPVVCARDVILCPTLEIDSGFSIEDLRAHPPVGFQLSGAGIEAESAPLGQGVVLDRLSSRDAERVMNACSPRGHHFVAIRQSGQRYSFIRELEPERVAQARSQWDADGVLSDCLALSRLVRDNAFSTQYAARIFDYADGQQQIIPALATDATRIYRLRTNRDWLDPAEAGELADLLRAYWRVRADLPDRVRRALWRAEWSCSIAWADVALPAIVSGLESLLKTERHGTTRQFVTRAPLLGSRVGIPGVTAELCYVAYDGRSSWIHGAHVRLFVQEDPKDEAALDARERVALRNVAVFQDLLRTTVRRAIEDTELQEIFSSDDSIRAQWPM